VEWEEGEIEYQPPADVRNAAMGTRGRESQAGDIYINIYIYI